MLIELTSQRDPTASALHLAHPYFIRRIQLGQPIVSVAAFLCICPSSPAHLLYEDALQTPLSAFETGKLTNSVPPGLIAAGIVSAWTWAATLLQSSATA
jgi:hypothetical protein